MRAQDRELLRGRHELTAALPSRPARCRRLPVSTWLRPVDEVGVPRARRGRAAARRRRGRDDHSVAGVGSDGCATLWSVGAAAVAGAVAALLGQRDLGPVRVGVGGRLGVVLEGDAPEAGAVGVGRARSRPGRPAAAMSECSCWRRALGSVGGVEAASSAHRAPVRSTSWRASVAQPVARAGRADHEPRALARRACSAARRPRCRVWAVCRRREVEVLADVVLVGAHRAHRRKARVVGQHRVDSECWPRTCW